jgi:hypothetical protein
VAGSRMLQLMVMLAGLLALVVVVFLVGRQGS